MTRPLNLTRAPAPIDVARALATHKAPALVFFDSGRAGARGRWSVITCAPSALIQARGGVCTLTERGVTRTLDAPWSWLVARGRPRREPRAGEPPFVGGLAGVLGYELAWWLDDVRAPRPVPQTPELWVGDFDAALAFDHEAGRWWWCGARDGEAARWLRDALELPVEATAQPPLDAPITPQWLVDPADGLSAQAHMAAQVEACVAAITAGELFEINYTERVGAPWPHGGWALYERMRRVASGAHMGFVDGGGWQLASVSPEQFLQVRGDQVVTRPIKGSRRRDADPERDAALAEALLASEKDRAENVMIVDLMRNDLTRVCVPGTVRAEAVCALESFAGIHHLVSTVRGQLEPTITPVEALLACAPAGSITGAPKLRAVEIAAEVEGTPRGLYTGALFYASRHGMLDSSVLIRSAEVCDGTLRYGAGGAVVADSSPTGEVEEAWLKVRPLIEALRDGG